MNQLPEMWRDVENNYGQGRHESQEFQFEQYERSDDCLHWLNSDHKEVQTGNAQQAEYNVDRSPDKLPSGGTVAWKLNEFDLARCKSL